MPHADAATSARRFSLAEIELQICDIASECLGIERDQISITSRMIDDLHCDSLELLDFIFRLEDTFKVWLPEPTRGADPLGKSIFTRPNLRLADMAEWVYSRQGMGSVPKRSWKDRERTKLLDSAAVSFTQLTGRYDSVAMAGLNPFERIETGNDPLQYRRRTDGMRCVLLPAADVEIGSPAERGQPDEHPQHTVAVDSFLIDAEPVSTSAYCRFLNSIEPTTPQQLRDWFVLTDDDDRHVHQLLEWTADEWRPHAGVETWPMILVSWFGAHAYARWANGRDPAEYDDEAPCFLPTEVQWEYAARGARCREFPWGDDPPTDARLRSARHRRGDNYTVASLPLAGVNEILGMSPFGLHHMAGNVWQWCADWYDADFYSQPEASERNARNRRATGTRSERGGSWIGPADLCRSSYRRGRTPTARGRCLGFRCVSPVDQLPR